MTTQQEKMDMKIRTTVILMLFLTSGLFAQRNFDDVNIKSTHVNGKVYMLEGAGGNIGVSAGEDGILIVDDQFAPLAEKIRTALNEINPGKLKFILNTHWHGDHTGGNKVFGLEAPVIAHTNVRSRLITGAKRGDRTIPPAPKEAWPVITFDQSLSVHFNGEEIKVIHYPQGHTDGDAVVFFTKSNVVHMGDDFFSGRFPFVDLASGGTVQGLIRNVEEILKKLPPDVKLIPGHGPLSNLEDLKLYHRMLTETVAHVRKQMQEGKPLEAIQKGGLPDEWQSWSGGFISTARWIETIYNSYSIQER